MKNSIQERVLRKCIEGDVDLRDNLELFTIFISSNPNFKYNKTYLSDSIDPFLYVVPILKRKFRFFKKLTDKLANQTYSEFDGAIIFDGIFEFRVNYSVASQVNFVNIENFRFDQIKEEEFTIKFVWNVNHDFQRTEIQKLNINDTRKIMRLWKHFIN